MRGTIQELDQIDHDNACRKLLKFDAVETPRVGDYVIFADGRERRISYVYGPDWEELSGVQTSDGGSWYFGNGYCDFSGALYPIVRMDTLTRTDEIKMGSVWFFHHGYHTAGNGIDFMIPFRVYKCSVEAPR